MSEDAKEEMLDLLDELTDIARTGQAISIVSGYHLVCWGTIVALTCLASLMSLQYELPVTDLQIWPVAMLLGWLGSRWLGARRTSPSDTGAAATANRTARYVWVFVGIAASLVTIGEAVELIDFGGRAYFIAFLLCALGLIMTAAAMSEPLLLLSGGGWFVIGFGTLFLEPGATVLYSATIIACLVFLVVPGLIISARRD